MLEVVLILKYPPYFVKSRIRLNDIVPCSWTQAVFNFSCNYTRKKGGGVQFSILVILRFKYSVESLLPTHGYQTIRSEVYSSYGITAIIFGLTYLVFGWQRKQLITHDVIKLFTLVGGAA